MSEAIVMAGCGAYSGDSGFLASLVEKGLKEIDELVQKIFKK